MVNLATERIHIPTKLEQNNLVSSPKERSNDKIKEEIPNKQAANNPTRPYSHFFKKIITTYRIKAPNTLVRNYKADSIRS